MLSFFFRSLIQHLRSKFLRRDEILPSFFGRYSGLGIVFSSFSCFHVIFSDSSPILFFGSLPLSRGPPKSLLFCGSSSGDDFWLQCHCLRPYIFFYFMRVPPLQFFFFFADLSLFAPIQVFFLFFVSRSRHTMLAVIFVSPRSKMEIKRWLPPSHVASFFFSLSPSDPYSC